MPKNNPKINPGGSIRLDIGCAQHKLPGWTGVDILPGPGVDIVADLHSLPFGDSTVDILHTRHTLEHIADPLQCIAEMYRVVKPSGRIIVIVPHYSNPAYWADITHKRPFGVRTFEYFDLEYARRAGYPIYKSNINFKTHKTELTYWPGRIQFHGRLKRACLLMLDKIFSGLANLNPRLCERTWCFWVGGFYEVTFELEPIK
ncbi:MAG: class I SAM-dependent methyltransferase [Calditrichaeota bacterium]|nr:class I SAM-dependent methyltransferase [Calditrichota bacterium]